MGIFQPLAASERESVNDRIRAEFPPARPSPRGLVRKGCSNADRARKRLLTKRRTPTTLEIP
jgi:hypothetical protein